MHKDYMNRKVILSDERKKNAISIILNLMVSSLLIQLKQ